MPPDMGSRASSPAGTVTIVYNASAEPDAGPQVVPRAISQGRPVVPARELCRDRAPPALKARHRPPTTAPKEHFRLLRRFVLIRTQLAGGTPAFPCLRPRITCLLHRVPGVIICKVAAGPADKHDRLYGRSEALRPYSLFNRRFLCKSQKKQLTDGRLLQV